MNESKKNAVEKVIGMRIRNGIWEYKIKWRGYPDSHNTWETKATFNCEEAIRAFIESIPSPKRGSTTTKSTSPISFVNNEKMNRKSRTPEAGKSKTSGKLISSNLEMEQEISSQKFRPGPSAVDAKTKRSRKSMPIKCHSVIDENQNEKVGTQEKMLIVSAGKENYRRKLRSYSLESKRSPVNADTKTETSREEIHPAEVKSDKKRRMSAPAGEFATHSKSEMLQSPVPDKKRKKSEPINRREVHAISSHKPPAKSLLSKEPSQGDRKELTTPRKTGIPTPSKGVKTQTKRGRHSVEYKSSAKGEGLSDVEMVQRRSSQSTPSRGRTRVHLSGINPNTSTGLRTPEKSSILMPDKEKNRRPLLELSEFKYIEIAGTQIQPNGEGIFQTPRKHRKSRRLNLHPILTKLTGFQQQEEMSSSSVPAVDSLQDSERSDDVIRSPKVIHKLTENKDPIFNEKGEIPFRPRFSTKRLLDKTMDDNTDDAEQINLRKSKRLKVCNDSPIQQRTTPGFRKRYAPDNRIEDFDSIGELSPSKVRRTPEVQTNWNSTKATSSTADDANMTPNKGTKQQRMSTESIKKEMSGNTTEENEPAKPQSITKLILVTPLQSHGSQTSAPETHKQETRNLIDRKKATVRIEFRSPENCKVESVNQNTISYFDGICEKPAPKGTLMTAKSRFDLGMKVDKIAGSTVDNGKILFLATWIGTSEAEIVPAEVANKKCPQAVIKYYESLWNCRKEENRRK